VSFLQSSYTFFSLDGRAGSSRWNMIFNLSGK